MIYAFHRSKNINLMFIAGSQFADTFSQNQLVCLITKAKVTAMI